MWISWYTFFRSRRGAITIWSGSGNPQRSLNLKIWYRSRGSELRHERPCGSARRANSLNRKEREVRKENQLEQFLSGSFAWSAIFAVEIFCRETHHRMDWQDEEPRDPISHRRLPKTSEAIRRCRWDSPQRRTGFTEAVWPRRPQHATLARASGFTRKAAVLRRAGGLQSWPSG